MFTRVFSSKLAVISTAYRRLSTTAICPAKKIVERTEGNVTVVELENVPEPEGVKFNDGKHKCALCAIPIKIKYTDVLILEQFMREDGTVLPNQLTGLCGKQHHRLERCVMQAHWAGLFPDRTIPDFDRAGYKRFNRYWEDDMDMYKTQIKVKPGSWFYSHQHRPRAVLYKDQKYSEDSSTSASS